MLNVRRHLESSVILDAKKYLDVVGWTEADLLSISKFSIKKLYKEMRGDFIKVEWRRLTLQ